MTDLLEYIILIKCVSNLLFLYMIDKDLINLATFFNLILGILIVFLPMAYLNNKFFKVAAAPPNELDYFQASL